ncbi:sensor histidine kinase [Hahella ganghwensis]|uniref:sensor histidine kinase n=1 Tax=Hahella ganghwensis TaxID=286420 RepID=UPI0003721803|nr:HAMP domain-containing sensor histidine kinase [Hahella ganghwensis]
MKVRLGIQSYIVTRFLAVLCLLLLLTLFLGRYLKNLSLDESTEYYMYTEAEWIDAHYSPPDLPEFQPGLREYYWGEDQLPNDVTAIFRPASWRNGEVLLAEHENQTVYLLAFQSSQSSPLSESTDQKETLFVIHRFTAKQLDDEYSTLYGNLYVALFASFGLAIMTGFWTSQRIRQPVSDLSSWVNQLRDSSSPPLPPASADRFNETRNITDSLVEAIRQLEEANQKEKDFLKVLSHELKTPMAITSGAIQLLDARNAISIEQRKYWDKLKNAQKTMQTLSQTVLDLWRAHPVTDTQPVDITRLLKQVLKDNKYLQKPSVEVSIRIDGPVEVSTSPSLLKLALNNLIRNALQYTVEGEIDIHTVSAPAPAKLIITNPCQNQEAEATYMHTADDLPAKDYGYGVGLFLVEKICEQKHWSFHTRKENQRFCVVIELSG